MAVLGGRRLAIVISVIAALLVVAAAIAVAVLRPPAPEGTAGPPTTRAPAASGPVVGGGSPASTTYPTVSEEPGGIVLPPAPGATLGPGDEPASPDVEPGNPSDIPLPAPPPQPGVPVPGPPPQPGSPVPSPQPVPQPGALPDALRGLDVERIPTTARVAALTFDAGAGSQGLASILATLKSEQVPATFFVTGQWALANPGGVAGIAAAGHRLGSHSMTHAAFTGLTDAGIATDLARAQAAIVAGGGDPRPLFRFPYGDRDARTIAAVNANGYAAVRWTVDSLGWQGTMGGSRGPAFVVSRVMGAATPGLIVLMHVGAHPQDGSTLDADALPALIAQLRAAGYRFVTLDVLL